MASTGQITPPGGTAGHSGEYPENSISRPDPNRRRYRRKRSHATLAKVFIGLLAAGGVLHYFGAMPNMPDEPRGAGAVTTRAFSDPNGKSACALPEGSYVVIESGWYEHSNGNRWSIAHDKLRRPEVGDFTVRIPLTPQRVANGCMSSAEMHPRDFHVVVEDPIRAERQFMLQNHRAAPK